ncbi:hypothetical protein P7K49_028539 [Saguinus oedipus]|uniref:Uncharacterized protein n=1 Tax=Saguinus oedipus TaxID=9490 RepID=A0ABQ9U4M6_SAGOE|nr:hypothetical protein P7K49_028539 [Saguinus oedipus]
MHTKEAESPLLGRAPVVPRPSIESSCEKVETQILLSPWPLLLPAPVVGQVTLRPLRFPSVAQLTETAGVVPAPPACMPLWVSGKKSERPLQTQRLRSDSSVALALECILPAGTSACPAYWFG